MKTGIFFVSYGICAMAANVFFILIILSIFGSHQKPGHTVVLALNFLECTAAAFFSLRTYLNGVVESCREKH